MCVFVCVCVCVSVQLVEFLTPLLEGSADGWAIFKASSGQFRRGQMSAAQYLGGVERLLGAAVVDVVPLIAGRRIAPGEVGGGVVAVV